MVITPTVPTPVISQVVEALLRAGAVRATKFLSEKEIVRASRKTYDGKIKQDKVEVLLTLGRPNYREREFVKKLKKAGEPFPVKKVQLKFPAVKK